MEQNTIDEGKTIAIISYLTFIGTIIAFVMNNDKKNAFAAFHIRQMVGLITLGIAINLIVRFSGMPMLGFLGLFPMILWIIGLIGAVQGQEKKVPLLGDQFQEWFKGIG
ncbi:hypothetical protein UMM65_10170 [Aureibaculum sp. 2210JD6-5]|uniref:DUF4870 domain-containing protein n=1 Tax=Aureibaculum sp. 2210JD6-5 TaxID=3103957 RepID=UPI002AAD920D|nr:hypothetical protein [Aureibaculum sp. 2210JD6-5]MDY7395608.1 hypothetical protein [Aureibaculum sp. 2210JD6-5]